MENTKTHDQIHHQKQQHELKDCDKIQIESVDSSFKELSEHRNEKKQRHNNMDSRDRKQSRKKSKRTDTDDEASSESDDNKSINSSRSNLSSSSISVTRGRKYTKSRKHQKTSRAESGNSDSGSVSDSAASRSSSSQSSSVSELLSDSESNMNHSGNEKSNNNVSEDSDSKVYKQRQRRKISGRHNKKRRNMSRSSSGGGQSSSGSGENGDSSDDCSGRNNNNNETNSDIEKGEHHRKKYSASNKKLLKEKILLLTQKCSGYSGEITKTIKQLKVLKKKKQMCSSNKEKLRYELHKKKLFKKKRKLENKLKVYQHRLDSLKRSAKKHSSQKNREKAGKYNNLNQMDNNYSEEIMHQSNNLASGTGNMKLPYPVLNDKRDQKIILDILKSKQVHLNGMLAQTLETMRNIDMNKGNPNYEDQKARHSRLRNLEENIKVQLTRMSRQIDFINFNLEIHKITRSVRRLEENQDSDEDESNHNFEKISRSHKKLKDLHQKVDHLFTFMKDANLRFLKQQETQSDSKPHQPHADHDDICSSKATTELENLKETNKASTSSLPITYYRNVPPPLPGSNSNNTRDTSFQEAHVTPNNNKSMKSAKPVFTKNPNHNIHKIVNESTNFNNQNHGSGRNDFHNKNSLSKSNSKRASDYPSENYQQQQTTDFEHNQKNVNTPPGRPNPVPSVKPDVSKPTITSDSDPKAIAAMLNEKYGYKKSMKDPKSESSSKSGQQQLPNNTSIQAPPSNHNNSQFPNQSDPNKANNNNFQRNGIQNNRDNRFNSNLLSSNLPNSLLNSPAFMSSMTNMLQSMSHQGVNVNAIMNQLPGILSNFNSNSEFGDNSYTNQSNANRGQSNRGYSNNNYYNQQLQQDDSALLPNPVDVGNNNIPENNYEKSFCNYLSNVFQNMDQGINPSMSASQINQMFVDSGLIEDFNAYYNSEVNKDNQNHNQNQDNRYYNNNINNDNMQISNNNNNNNQAMNYSNSNEYYNNNGNANWNNSYSNDYQNSSNDYRSHYFGKNMPHHHHNGRNFSRTSNNQNMNGNYRRKRY